MTVRMNNLLRSGALLGVVMALLALPAVAQPPGGGAGGQGRGGFGGGGFGGGGGLMGLLGNDDVKKELQLLDDQTAKIETIQTDMRAEMRELFQPGGDQEANRAKFAELGKKTEEEIAKVLDSDQLKRLKQIEFQQTVNRAMGGFASGIISDSVVEKLGLSKEQVEVLTEAQKAADEEMRKKQAALRAEALEKLVATLSPEQQAAFKDAYGKHFEMRFNFGGAGRGAGGGQGGNRGGGNRGGRPGGDRDL